MLDKGGARLMSYLLHALLVGHMLMVAGVRGFATSCHHIAFIDKVTEATFEAEKRCKTVAKDWPKSEVN